MFKGMKDTISAFKSECISNNKYFPSQQVMWIKYGSFLAGVEISG